jgi:hypothetical protein
MFSSDQKKQLKELGRTTTGRVVVECIEAMQAHYSSIATIDKTRAVEPQIEGRTILNEALEEFKNAFHTQKQPNKPLPTESFE